jgi:hypothetical protein
MQCAKCPWKVSTDPHDIPNGYCAVKHAKLKGTIASGVDLGIGRGLRVMACHESEVGKELPCVGWLVNQLGPGNNIALRLAVLAKRIDANVECVGKQHRTFEDTIPEGG